MDHGRLVLVELVFAQLDGSPLAAAKPKLRRELDLGVAAKRKREQREDQRRQIQNGTPQPPLLTEERGRGAQEPSWRPAGTHATKPALRTRPPSAGCGADIIPGYGKKAPRSPPSRSGARAREDGKRKRAKRDRFRDHCAWQTA